MSRTILTVSIVLFAIGCSDERLIELETRVEGLETDLEARVERLEEEEKSFQDWQTRMDAFTDKTLQTIEVLEEWQIRMNAFSDKAVETLELSKEWQSGIIEELEGNASKTNHAVQALEKMEEQLSQLKLLSTNLANQQKDSFLATHERLKRLENIRNEMNELWAEHRKHTSLSSKAFSGLLETDKGLTIAIEELSGLRP